MKIKKLLFILVAALLLVSAVSCGGDDSYSDDGYEEEYTEAYDEEMDEEDSEEVDEEEADEEDAGEDEETGEDSDGESAGPVDDSACGIFLGEFFDTEGEGGGAEVS